MAVVIMNGVKYKSLQLGNPIPTTSAHLARSDSSARAVVFLGDLPGSKTDLLTILDDRIDRLDRHGKFEECDIAKRAREQLFPECKSETKKDEGHDRHEP